jgi:hypothetical protein
LEGGRPFSFGKGLSLFIEFVGRLLSRPKSLTHPHPLIKGLHKPHHLLRDPLHDRLAFQNAGLDLQGPHDVIPQRLPTGKQIGLHHIAQLIRYQLLFFAERIESLLPLFVPEGFEGVGDVVYVLDVGQVLIL